MRAAITGQKFVITDVPLTVSESVGIYECDFTFDESWDGWTKTAVFQGSGETIEVVVVDDRAQIPWEVLKDNGRMLVGVYGTRGAQVKPTTWSGDIYVSLGTTTGSIGTEPTPSIYSQILAAADEAVDRADAALERSKALGVNNAGSHNAIYRGKNLGTEVTSDQSAAIAAGTFDDLYIGDYWEIDNNNWRIAAFDYYYRAQQGSGTPPLTDHHIVIVPDYALYNARMNPTDTTDTAFGGSELFTTGLAQADEIVTAAFGNHVLPFKLILEHQASQGIPVLEAWAQDEVTTCLMSEINVFGSRVSSSPHAAGTVALPTMDVAQYPLFAMDMSCIRGGVANDEAYRWWLRDVVNVHTFAIVNQGIAYNMKAKTAISVRPFFLIK